MKIISKFQVWRNERRIKRRINRSLSRFVRAQIETQPTIGGVRVLVPLTE